MKTDQVSPTIDHESRNEYLIGIDEAWELCRDAVEGARTAYEDALETVRITYELEQSDASAAHHKALDAAWSLYKEHVSDTPSPDRRALISEARAAYNEAAAKIRQTFDDEMSSAQDDYTAGLKEARSLYEAAVDESFAAHRRAIHGVQGLGGTGGTEDDDGIDYLELAEAMAARASGSQGAAVPKASDKSVDEAGEVKPENLDDVVQAELATLNGSGS